jgi:hypothetical protein
MAARGAAVDAGPADTWRAAARRALDLLADAPHRARLSSAGRALVDGRGAERAARALHALAREKAGAP